MKAWHQKHVLKNKHIQKFPYSNSVLCAYAWIMCGCWDWDSSWGSWNFSLRKAQSLYWAKWGTIDARQKYCFSITTRTLVLFWNSLTCQTVSRVKSAHPKILSFLYFLAGPKGPGGASIPNNYCNKCQGSNKKTGKSGTPYSACRCTSESMYTKV